jgi:hypothetical protein
VYILLHSKPTLLLPEKYATIPRSSLVLRQLPGHCQVVAFPLCHLSSQGDYSPVYRVVVFPLLQWRYNLHRAMAAGLASVSSILMAGKLALSGLTTGRNYPVCHRCFLSETCRPPGRAVSAGGEKAPCRIDSSVFSLCRNKASCMVSYRQTSALCEKRHCQLTLCHCRGSSPLFSVRALY